MSRKPRYPIYIPSKGRAGRSETARLFDSEGVPYLVVVEPQEVDAYAQRIDKSKLVVLPENDQGLVYSRNFCKQHSIDSGAERHWQFDDDIRLIGRMYKRYRLRIDAGIALAECENFVERYENVGLASLNHIGFLPPKMRIPPFYLNARCYTCFLMWNELPNTFRNRYNEDTDMTLQVLAAGYCTILFNTFYMQTGSTNSGGKITVATGGQADHYAGDGRLRMSRAMEVQWPRIVKTTRKFGRPQHKVHSNWMRFDTPLIRRSDIDWEALEAAGPSELGMTLKAVAEIKSGELKDLYESYREEQA